MMSSIDLSPTTAALTGCIDGVSDVYGGMQSSSVKSGGRLSATSLSRYIYLTRIASHHALVSLLNGQCPNRMH